MRTYEEWQKYLDYANPKDGDLVHVGLRRMCDAQLELMREFLEWWKEQEQKVHPVFVGTMNADGTYTITLRLDGTSAPPK